MQKLRTKISNNSYVVIYNLSGEFIKLQEIYLDNQQLIECVDVGEIEFNANQKKIIFLKIIQNPESEKRKETEMRFGKLAFWKTYLTANPYTVKSIVNFYQKRAFLYEDLFAEIQVDYTEDKTRNILFLKEGLEKVFQDLISDYANSLDQEPDWLANDLDQEAAQQEIFSYLNTEYFDLTRELELLERIHYICTVSDRLDDSYLPYKAYHDCATIREAIAYFKSDPEIQKYLEDRDRYLVSFRSNSYIL